MEDKPLPEWRELMAGTSRYDLKSVLDLEKWHPMQESLSQVTRMAIITVNYKGIPVTAHSRCQPFCESVRRDPELSAYCQKCDARGGLEAVRLNKPYIYRCHFNIIDIAIPILVDNQYIGALMAGQIRLSGSGGPQLEQIVRRPEEVEGSAAVTERERLYQSLPSLTYEEITAVSDMLFQLCSYIVQEAIHKNEIIEVYKKAISYRPEHPPELAPSAAKTPYTTIEKIRRELSNAAVETRISQSAVQPYHAANPTLQPAFDYIYAHKNETYTLSALARLCHISPTYFSRIFAKETGESFSVFIHRLKMEWARQLLETTDQPVNRISSDLGFCDAGYFIKIFRKQLGLTPAAYRTGHRGGHRRT